MCYCPSVCRYVTQVDQSKTVEVRIMQPSPQISPMTLVFWCLTSWWNSKGKIGAVALNDRGRKNTQFSANKSPYLGNGALSIGTKIIDLGWPWTAVSSNFLAILRCLAFLEASTAKWMKIVPHCRKLLHTESSFQQYIDYVDIAGRSYARSDLVSCVLYTKTVACLPLR